MTTLQTLVSHSFNGTIWRLLPDAKTNILAIEVRNEQDKQTSFATLNMASGEVYFTKLTMPERWLTGVEAIDDGVLLLHYYKHETSPEHKAIIAINAVTGEELWSNYSLSFDHLSVNGPVVYNLNLQPKKLMVADMTTGSIIRPYSPAMDKPLANHIVIPEVKAADKLLPGALPDEPYGNMVHYLNHNNYIIVSLHTFKKGDLQQHLYVSKNGEVVYYDLLNEHIQKIQPEAFVLHKNALLYVKNKSEIKVLQL